MFSKPCQPQKEKIKKKEKKKSLIFWKWWPSGLSVCQTWRWAGDGAAVSRMSVFLWTAVNQATNQPVIQLSQAVSDERNNVLEIARGKQKRRLKNTSSIVFFSSSYHFIKLKRDFVKNIRENNVNIEVVFYFL